MRRLLSAPVQEKKGDPEMRCKEGHNATLKGGVGTAETRAAQL